MTQIKNKNNTYVYKTNDIKNTDIINVSNINNINYNNKTNKKYIYIPTHNIHDVYEQFRIFKDTYINYENDPQGFQIHGFLDNYHAQSIKGWFPNLIEVRATTNANNFLILTTGSTYIKYNNNFIIDFNNVPNLIIDGITINDNDKVLIKDQYYEEIVFNNISTLLTFVNEKIFHVLYQTGLENIYQTNSQIIFSDGNEITENIIENVSIVNISGSDYLKIKTVNYFNNNITQVADINNSEYTLITAYNENGVYEYNNNQLTKLNDLMYDKLKTFNQIIYTYQGDFNSNKQFYLRRIEDNLIAEYGLFPYLNSHKFIYSEGNAHLIKCEINYDLNILQPLYPTNYPTDDTDLKNKNQYKLLFLDIDLGKKIMSSNDTLSGGIGDFNSVEIDCGVGYNNLVPINVITILGSPTQGTGAKLQALLNDDGEVIDTLIENGGSNYSTPSLTVIGLTINVPCTTAATFTFTRTAGVITAINIVTPGLGYKKMTNIHDISFKNVFNTNYSNVIQKQYNEYYNETNLDLNFKYKGLYTSLASYTVDFDNFILINNTTNNTFDIQGFYTNYFFQTNAFEINDLILIKFTNINTDEIVLEHVFINKYAPFLNSTEINVSLFPAIEQNILDDLLKLYDYNYLKLTIESINTYGDYVYDYVDPNIASFYDENNGIIFPNSERTLSLLEQNINKIILKDLYELIYRTVNEISILGDYKCYINVRNVRQSNKYKYENFNLNIETTDYLLAVQNYNFQHKLLDVDSGTALIYYNNYYNISNYFDYANIDTDLDITNCANINTILYTNINEDPDRFAIIHNTIILGENFINTVKSSLLENLFVELDFYGLSQTYTIQIKKIEYLVNENNINYCKITFDRQIITNEINTQNFDNENLNIIPIKNVYILSQFLDFLNLDNKNLTPYAYGLMNKVFSNTLANLTSDFSNHITGIVFNDNGYERISLRKREKTFKFENDLLSDYNKKDLRLTLKPVEIAQLGVDNKTRNQQKIYLKYDSQELTENFLNIEIGINNRRRIRFIDGLTEFNIINNINGQGQYAQILEEDVIVDFAIVGCTQDNGPGTGTLIQYTGTQENGTQEDGIQIQGNQIDGIQNNGTMNSYEIIDYFYYVIYSNTNNFTLTTVDNITQNNGVFNGGTINNGLQTNGTFNNGVINYLIQITGTFNNGIINDITQHNGSFYGGIFGAGVQYNGIFNQLDILIPAIFGAYSTLASRAVQYQGIFINGTFTTSGDDFLSSIQFSGEFRSGTQNNGTFVTGIFKTGTQNNGLQIGGYYINNTINMTNNVKRYEIDPDQYYNLLGVHNTSHKLHTYGETSFYLTAIPDSVLNNYDKITFYNIFEEYNNATYLKKSLSNTGIDSIDLNVTTEDGTITTYQQPDENNNIIDGNPFIHAIFNGGVFKNGIQLNGVFEDGIFENGAFINGILLNGTFGINSL